MGFVCTFLVLGSTPPASADYVPFAHTSPGDDPIVLLHGFFSPPGWDIAFSTDPGGDVVAYFADAFPLLRSRWPDAEVRSWAYYVCDGYGTRYRPAGEWASIDEYGFRGHQPDTDILQSDLSHDAHDRDGHSRTCDHDGGRQVPKSHTRSASIRHLAYHWAWAMHETYMKDGECIRVFAHSMGGLIARYGLHQVEANWDRAAAQTRNPLWPPWPTFCVRDVVTFGTPHGGSVAPVLGAQDWQGCTQCRQMFASNPGLPETYSEFLRELWEHAAHPNGAGGTSWTTIASESDGIVGKFSGVHMDADQRVIYSERHEIGHGDYFKGPQAGWDLGASVLYFYGPQTDFHARHFPSPWESNQLTYWPVRWAHEAFKFNEWGCGAIDSPWSLREGRLTSGTPDAWSSGGPQDRCRYTVKTYKFVTGFKIEVATDPTITNTVEVGVPTGFYAHADYHPAYGPPRIQCDSAPGRSYCSVSNIRHWNVNYNDGESGTWDWDVRVTGGPFTVRFHETQAVDCGHGDAPDARAAALPLAPDGSECEGAIQVYGSHDVEDWYRFDMADGQSFALTVTSTASAPEAAGIRYCLVAPSLSESCWALRGTTLPIGGDNQPGGTNWVRISRDTASEGAWAPYKIALSVVSRPPSEPRDLTATPQNGKVILTWTPPAHSGGSPIVEHRIYRTGPDGVTVTIPGVDAVATSHLDSGVSNGQSYRYRIAAVNAAGEGPRSAETTAMPAAPPGPPVIQSVTPGNSRVTLAWAAPTDPGTGVTAYRVLRADCPPCPVNEVATVDASARVHTDVGLQNTKTYYYHLTAVGPGGESSWSARVSATPRGAPPSAPRGLAATPESGAVKLSWTAPASDGGEPITGYRIYRGTSETSVGLLVGETQGTWARDIQDVENRRTYYYRVTAVSAAHEGAPTPVVSARPGTFAPYAPMLSCPTSVDTAEVFTCTAQAGDPEADPLAYFFEWGDGAITRVPEGGENVPAGKSVAASRAYYAAGAYSLQVRAHDGENYGAWTSWTITVVERAGDCGRSYDAGNTFDLATPIEYVPTACAGELSSADPNDYYQFYALSGDTLTATVTPPAGAAYDVCIMRPEFSYTEVPPCTNGNGSGETRTATHKARMSGWWRARVLRQWGSGAYELSIGLTGANPASGGPSTPTLSCSPSPVRVNQGTTCTASATSPRGEDLYYVFDWTDGSATERRPPGGAFTRHGEVVSASHSFSTVGKHQVLVTVFDRSGRSAWNTAIVTVEEKPPAATDPGDCNSGRDAGMHEDAVPLTIPVKYCSAVLRGNDLQDHYRFTASPGDHLRIRVDPDMGADLTLCVGGPSESRCSQTPGKGVPEEVSLTDWEGLTRRIEIWSETRPHPDVWYSLSVLVDTNDAPSRPRFNCAPRAIVTGEWTTCTLESHDPEGDALSYTIDWGDGSPPMISEALGSGTVRSFSHRYTKAGTFEVKAHARDWRLASEPASLSVLVRDAQSPPGRPALDCNVPVTEQRVEYYDEPEGDPYLRIVVASNADPLACTVRAPDPDGDMVRYTLAHGALRTSLWGHRVAPDREVSASEWVPSELPHALELPKWDAGTYGFVVHATDAYFHWQSPPVYVDVVVLPSAERDTPEVNPPAGVDLTRPMYGWDERAPERPIVTCRSALENRSSPVIATRSVPVVCTIRSTDPAGKRMRYEVDWGDGTLPVTTPLAASQERVAVEHAYETTGNFVLRVRAVNEDGRASLEAAVNVVVVPWYASGPSPRVGTNGAFCVLRPDACEEVHRRHKEADFLVRETGGVACDDFGVVLSPSEVETPDTSGLRDDPDFRARVQLPPPMDCRAMLGARGR